MMFLGILQDIGVSIIFGQQEPPPKGTQYFNKILSPRFYNKHKDLEVEIDSKGDIVR